MNLTVRARAGTRTARGLRRHVGVVVVVVVSLLHVVGFALLLLSQGHTGAAIGVGLGLTAYSLGLRHAFDADHIAAIDNTTRKLLGDGKHADTAGFWFALGHSTVVFALTVALALGVRAVADPLSASAAEARDVLGLIGTLVSGGFLYLIAAFNLRHLFSTVALLRRSRSVRINGAAVTAHLNEQGLLSRLLRPLSRGVTRPAHMYAIGLLFGLGFDTATEIGLLVLAASTAASGVPWWSLVSLPVLFAAGMTLLDTANGVFMSAAFGWASRGSERRLRYNLGVTALSVAVAVGVGTTELAGLLAEHLPSAGGAWQWFRTVDLSYIGFAVVGMFAFLWSLALVSRRVRGRTARRA